MTDTIVQIISVTAPDKRHSKADPSTGKESREYMIQEIQGVVLGDVPQVFKNAFFFFPDRETGAYPPAHVVEPNKKYRVNFALQVNRKNEVEPVLVGFTPV